VYSNSEDFEDESLAVDPSGTQMKDISGFVTCMYDDHWWVRCTLCVNEDADEIEKSFFHHRGLSTSFSYSSKPDVFGVKTANTVTRD
jgi:hypothetical protein